MASKDESQVNTYASSFRSPLINININDDGDDDNKAMKFDKIRKHKLKWNAEYVNALKNIFFVVQAKQYVPPSMPRAFLKAQNEKVNFVHMCKHCNDSFRLKSSLHEHENRKTCIFGYWCSECSHVKCMHNRQEPTGENSLCLPCQNIENQNKVCLRQRGLNPRMKIGAVQVFLNPCQLIAHAKLHNVSAAIANVDIDYIMHMPIPPEVDKIDESCELNCFIENCKLLMEYAFITERHITDVLNELGVLKWWTLKNLDLSLLDQGTRENSIDYSSDLLYESCTTTATAAIDSSSISLNNNLTSVDFSNMPVLDDSMIKEPRLTYSNCNRKTIFHYLNYENSNKLFDLMPKLSYADHDDNDDDEDEKTMIHTSTKKGRMLSKQAASQAAFIQKGNSQNSLSGDDNSDEIIITFDNSWDKLITISDDEEIFINDCQLEMRKELEEYSKEKIKKLIDDVRLVSANLVRANFVDSKAILENNEKFQKQLEKYLETAKRVKFEEGGNDQVNERLLSTCQLADNISSQSLCRRCNKQQKPSSYKIGITPDLLVEEKQYCQCYNFICHLCHSRQGNPRRFKEHLKFHSLEPPHTCPECFATFPNMQSLEVHIWAKCFHLNTQEIFRCNICQLEGFLTIEAIARHYYQFHSKLLFVCPNCENIQTSYHRYLMHYNEQHSSTFNATSNDPNSNPDPGILINCHFKDCLTSPEAFSVHISEAHSEIAKVQYYTCPLCPFFVKTVSGNEHIIQNHVFGSHKERLGAIMTAKTLNFFTSAFNLTMSGSRSNNNNNNNSNDNNNSGNNNGHNNTSSNGDNLNIKSTFTGQAERKMVIPKIVDACSIPPAAFDKTLLCNSKGSQNSSIQLKESAQRKQYYRIALIDDNLNFPSLKYRCHLCSEIITVDWQTIKHHFSVKHSQEYKLSIITPTLERMTQLKNYRKRKLQLNSDGHQLSNKNYSNHSNKKRFAVERELSDGKKSHEGICITQQNIGKNDNNLKCRKCEELFKSIDLLREHVSNIHRLKEHYLICLECGENFIVVNSLEMHLKAYHGIDDTSFYLAKNSIYAPNNGTSSYNLINTQFYRCNVCGTTFQEKVVADKHFRSHGLAFLKFRNMEVKSALKNDEVKG